MHGYELITVLEERSGGRWKPSPGAIYPALGKLEGRGLVTSTEQDGKRLYELTEEGHAVAAEIGKRTEGAPWEQMDLGGHGDMRRALAEFVGPARQIGRFGTPAQTEAANKIIKDATIKLYKLLADGPGRRPAITRSCWVNREGPCLTGNRLIWSPWPRRNARVSGRP